MALPDWPRAYGEPVLRAAMRTTPADFFVEEQLGFELDGIGEHCWLWVEKENLNTADAAQRLARFSNLRENDISYSGLKDKRALARQWFSLHLLNRQIDWNQWNDPMLQILRIERHSRKLRRGTHRSNYFEIILRDVEGTIDALSERVQLIIKYGVPNYFGEQRFGREGRNIDMAIRAATQKKKLPWQQANLYISAARAYLFNEVLAQRIVNNNWQTPSDGELFMLDRSNSIFAQIIDAEISGRFVDGDIHLTGPLPGVGRGIAPVNNVLKMEHDVLVRHPELVNFLNTTKVESARRSLRLLPENFRAEAIDNNAWRFSFTLAKGCFATSLVRELADYYLPTFE